jgi:hypothetical protein
MAERRSGAARKPRKLLRCVGAANGRDAIGDGDGREERRHESPKKSEGQRMAHQVDNQEPAARPPDVLDHGHHFVVGEVVRQT